MLHNFCFGVSAVALILISIIMLARANDLRWRKGLVWQVRLLGFVLAGVAPYGIVGYAVMGEWDIAFLFATIFLIGVTMVFVTTPYLPPFWKWITGIGIEPGTPVIEAEDRRRTDRKVSLDRRRDENP